MSSPADVARLNNAGVYLLNIGEATEGFQTFYRAVTTFRANIATHTQPALACKDMVFAASFQERGESIPALQNRHYFVYSRAFLFPMIDKQMGGSPHADDIRPDELAYPFLVFNMALASHCAGKLTGSLDSLDRAALLYDLLIRVLDSHACDSDTALKVLVSITINNAAILQLELGNHNECHNLFEDLEVQLVDSENYLDTCLYIAEATELRLNVQQAGQPHSLAPAA